MDLNKRLSLPIFLVSFFLSTLSSFAQVKYWVKLTDKNGTPYSVSTPSAFLSPQAISRRAMYNIPLDQTDLPVTPSYIAQIENVANVTVVYASKWLNGVVVSVPNRTLALTALSTIHNFPFVTDTLRVKRMKLNKPLPSEFIPGNEASLKPTSSSTLSTYNYGGSYWQNQQLNVICLHEQGYRGQGMTIAVMDAGFINVDTYSVFDSLRNNGGILGTRDFVNGAANAYYGSRHGTMVLSCMAGNKPGRILGSAPLAKYWLLRTEDESSETITEEYNWIRGAEFADSAGADILTTSLGYTDFNISSQNHTYATLNGKTAPMSIAATMASRKGMFVLNAAGNEGQSSWRYISVAADADSICAVGAIDSLENVAGFSSVGPTPDGRIKPDLVARGSGAWVSDGIYDGFPGNGTSFATPILAGAVACFWQANKTINNHVVMDRLKKSASNACKPNNSGGWGLPKVCYTTLTNTLSGFVFLKGKTDHSGIKVICVKDSVLNTTDSAFTAADGSYTFSLNTNYSKLLFSKPGYIDLKLINSDSNPLSRCNTASSTTLSPVPADAPDPGFDYTVYADPVKSELQLVLSKTNYDFIKVEIFDYVGRVMTTVDLPNTQYTFYFDISFFPDYVYIIKVSTSKGTLTKKFLKQ